MLRFLLNVLWFVLGGVVMGLGWWLAGLVAAITIVGLPWARAHLSFAGVFVMDLGR
jgi:uncharacterized membrane protein YccF (DUF307 family)